MAKITITIDQPDKVELDIKKPLKNDKCMTSKELFAASTIAIMDSLRSSSGPSTKTNKTLTMTKLQDLLSRADRLRLAEFDECVDRCKLFCIMSRNTIPSDTGIRCSGIFCQTGILLKLLVDQGYINFSGE